MTKGAHPETRRMMETAIRRLNTLEYVILGVAMLLALLAGALAAWMVQDLAGAPFRLSWALASLTSMPPAGAVSAAVVCAGVSGSAGLIRCRRSASSSPSSESLVGISST